MNASQRSKESKHTPEEDSKVSDDTNKAFANHSSLRFTSSRYGHQAAPTVQSKVFLPPEVDQYKQKKKDDPMEIVELELTMADPGFPRGGGPQPPRWGHQPIILVNFPCKLHEYEKIKTGGGGGVSLAPPLDPAKGTACCRENCTKKLYRMMIRVKMSQKELPTEQTL